MEDDRTFVLSRYFNGEMFEPKVISKHEHYAQCALIAELFGYRLWSADYLPQLAQQAARESCGATSRPVSSSPS